MGMGGEPGNHRQAEPVQVIGELVQIGTVDAGINQVINPSSPRTTMALLLQYRLALPDPDAVGHLVQHRIDPVRYVDHGAITPSTSTYSSAAVRGRAVESPPLAVLRMVAVPEFLTSDRFELELVDGDPTVTLRDAHVSSSEGWSFLNRLTVLVIDGPGEEGFLLPRHVDTGGDPAPAGWDSVIERRGVVAVRASGTQLVARVVG